MVIILFRIIIIIIIVLILDISPQNKSKSWKPGNAQVKGISNILEKLLLSVPSISQKGSNATQHQNMFFAFAATPVVCGFVNM